MAPTRFKKHDILATKLSAKFGVEYDAISALVTDTEENIEIASDEGWIYVGDKIESIDSILERFASFLHTTTENCPYDLDNLKWLYGSFGKMVEYGMEDALSHLKIESRLDPQMRYVAVDVRCTQADHYFNSVLEDYATSMKKGVANPPSWCKVSVKEDISPTTRLRRVCMEIPLDNNLKVKRYKETYGNGLLI